MPKKSSKEGEAQPQQPQVQPQVADVTPPQAAPQPVQPISPQQPPQQPVQPQAVSQPASSRGKSLKFIILGIVLIAAGIGGYGFWNGMQVKNYVSKVEPMRNNSKEWSKLIEEDALSNINLNSASDLSSAKSSVSEAKSKIEKIKSDSENYLNELNKTKAPAKAAQLEKDLKEYFSITKDMSDYGVYAVEIMDAAVKVMDEMNSLSFSMGLGTDVTDEATAMKKVADAFNSFAADIEKITPPESLKSTHEEMVSSLKKMAKSLEAGDTTAFQTMSNPFEGIDSDKIKSDIDQKKARGDELEKKIDNQISSLKSAGPFVF